MCGLDALTYAVCRSPLACCASIRTTAVTAAINTALTATRIPSLMQCLRKQLSRSGSRSDRRSGFGEASRLDVRVRADLRQLEGVAPVKPRLRELERQLHSVDVPVIGVVRLRRNLADR